MFIPSLPQLQSFLSKLGSESLRSLLPIDVLISKKLDPTTYLIKITSENAKANEALNKEFEVKSAKPLQVGQTYLASLTKDAKSNTIFLKHLHLAPLQEQQAYMRIEEVIKHFSQPSKKAISSFHSDVLNHLSNAASKEEFTFYTQLLLGLMENIVSLPFKYSHGFGLLQYKKRKKQEKQSTESVQFYAHLKHLGPIDGIISLKNDTLSIVLYVLFEESLSILEDNLDDFPLKEAITVKMKDEISPLFSLKSNMLDINI